MKHLILMFVSAVLAGCATLISGTSNEIYFATNVDPVRVFIEGRFVGKTPLSIDVEKKTGKGPLVRLEKAGYETQEFHLVNTFDMVAILDISSPLTSGGIDLISGALKEYQPREYHVELFKPDELTTKSKHEKMEFVNFVLTNAPSLQESLAKGKGESLDALLLLVNKETSSQDFSLWLSENSGMLMAANDPSELLSKLRLSGMTP